MLSSAAGSGPMGQNKKRKQERAIRAIRLVYYLRGESSVTWNRGNPHTHTHTHKNMKRAKQWNGRGFSFCFPPPLRKKKQSNQERKADQLSICWDYVPVAEKKGRKTDKRFPRLRPKNQLTCNTQSPVHRVRTAIETKQKEKKIVYEEPSRRRKCHQKRNKKTKKTCLCVHFHAPSPSFLPPHSVFILFFSQIRTPSRVAEYTRSFFRFPPCSVVSFFIDVVASLLLLFLSFFYAPRSASLAGDV